MDNIIGIIGSRRRDTMNDRLLVNAAFFKIYKKGDWIVSGHCKKGGDRFAEIISEDYGIPILLFPPNKSSNNYIESLFNRNTKVARWSTKALIACVAEDRTGGTEDTIKKYINFYKENANLILV